MFYSIPFEFILFYSILFECMLLYFILFNSSLVYVSPGHASSLMWSTSALRSCYLSSRYNSRDLKRVVQPEMPRPQWFTWSCFLPFVFSISCTDEKVHECSSAVECCRRRRSCASCAAGRFGPSQCDPLRDPSELSLGKVRRASLRCCCCFSSAFLWLS